MEGPEFELATTSFFVKYVLLIINIFVVVVAQLVERSIPPPEIYGSIPVIGKFDLLSTVSKKEAEKCKVE